MDEDREEKNTTNSEGYIFVSHNHGDIKTVRAIRNQLEEGGFEPILFYLKCMDTSDADRAKLKELICHEIDARKWFLYVDSEKARHSTWVQDEVAYIRQNAKDHVIKSIDIDALSEEEVHKEVVKMMRALTVFISHSHADRDVYQRFADAFRQNEVRVLDIESLIVGDDIASSITAKIDEAAQKGGIVYLMSEKSMRSEWVKHELEYAHDKKARIYPVVLGRTVAPSRWVADTLGDVQWSRCDGTPASVDACVQDIISAMKDSLL